MGASIILWLVAVYTARTALCGNPLTRMVRRAEPEFAARLDALTMHQAGEITVEELRFLRRFSRLGLLEMIMLGVELVLFAVLWWRNVLPVLTLGIFLKNIVMMGFSVVLAYTYMANGVFRALLALPPWIGFVERASALVSAAGALATLLHLNGWDGIFTGAGG